MGNKTYLSEKVADLLMQYIIQNNLKAGDKLPNEFTLAQNLGVGRSTLREGIRALVSRNILQTQRGAGTFVAREKVGVNDDPLGFAFIEDKNRLASDLMEIRLMIEPRIAAMAAKNATIEEIERITCLAQETENIILAGQNHNDKDVEFHFEIAKASKNIIAPTLLPIIQKSISIFIDVTASQLRRETIDTHQSIVQAIQRRDEIAASDAVYLHLIYNRQVILKKLNLDNR
ncbi:MAG: GntR family transcriptional regulator, transcriptional repressor for pyruvate dehydrogenase complex [Clostridiales bacterium]|nr:GntR family transcriptional regulator, transcriptional repressor for pyruvate dehydrogenase complex [Clostridiales bacterium]